MFLHEYFHAALDELVEARELDGFSLHVLGRCGDKHMLSRVLLRKADRVSVMSVLTPRRVESHAQDKLTSRFCAQCLTSLGDCNG